MQAGGEIGETFRLYGSMLKNMPNQYKHAQWLH